MATASLVELIVLNIGLNAGILNAAVFAMFVLMGKSIRGNRQLQLMLGLQPW